MSVMQNVVLPSGILLEFGSMKEKLSDIRNVGYKCAV